jgi:hypothetical protein
VAVVAHQVGQVLMQGAAERDVEDLQAPADAEDRQPAGQRALAQVEFGAVAVGVERPGRGVRGGAVPGRLDVAPAG